MFPEPQGLSTAEMQTIAREMNFSESTFILPAEGVGADPGRAGRRCESSLLAPSCQWPGIRRSAARLRSPRRESSRPGRRFRVRARRRPHAGVAEWSGEQAVVRVDDATPAVVRRDRVGSRGVVGRRSESRRVNLRPPAAAGGVVRRAVHVRPVASRAAVDRVSVDLSADGGATPKQESRSYLLFFFTTDGAGTNGDSAETVYSRMLAPSFGIVEDPATGGASGPLGCYLGALRDRSVRGGPGHREPARCRDGTAQPHLHLDRRPDGGITRVRVGGHRCCWQRGLVLMTTRRRRGFEGFTGYRAIRAIRSRFSVVGWTFSLQFSCSNHRASHRTTPTYNLT